MIAKSIIELNMRRQLKDFGTERLEEEEDAAFEFSPQKKQNWNTSLNHVADIFALIYYSYFQLPLSLSSDDHLASCDDAVYSEASWNTKSKQAHLTNIFFFTFFFFLSLPNSSFLARWDYIKWTVVSQPVSLLWIGQGKQKSNFKIK